MKVKCVKDHDSETSGFFKKETKQVKVEGITEGKEYNAEVVVAVKGSISNGYGDIKSKVKFLICDDDDNWELLDPKYFRSTESK